MCTLCMIQTFRYAHCNEKIKDTLKHIMVVSHLIWDICLLLGEFVVVSHLKIFPLQLLEPADKPMAGPSSSKGKILR